MYKWLVFGVILSSYILDIEGFIVPDEIPTIFSVIYSNIPKVRVGTDSRLGWGFRFGDRADFQVLLELGPQKNTQPLVNDEPVTVDDRNTLIDLSSASEILKEDNRLKQKEEEQSLCDKNAENMSRRITDTNEMQRKETKSYENKQNQVPILSVIQEGLDSLSRTLPLLPTRFSELNDKQVEAMVEITSGIRERMEKEQRKMNHEIGGSKLNQKPMQKNEEKEYNNEERDSKHTLVENMINTMDLKAISELIARMKTLIKERIEPHKLLDDEDIEIDKKHMEGGTLPMDTKNLTENITEDLTQIENEHKKNDDQQAKVPVSNLDEMIHTLKNLQQQMNQTKESDQYDDQKGINGFIPQFSEPKDFLKENDDEIENGQEKQNDPLSIEINALDSLMSQLITKLIEKKKNKGEEQKNETNAEMNTLISIYKIIEEKKKEQSLKNIKNLSANAENIFMNHPTAMVESERDTETYEATTSEMKPYEEGVERNEEEKNRNNNTKTNILNNKKKNGLSSLFHLMEEEVGRQNEENIQRQKEHSDISRSGDQVNITHTEISALKGIPDEKSRGGGLNVLQKLIHALNEENMKNHEKIHTPERRTNGNNRMENDIMTNLISTLEFHINKEEMKQREKVTSKERKDNISNDEIDAMKTLMERVKMLRKKTMEISKESDLTKVQRGPLRLFSTQLDIERKMKDYDVKNRTDSIDGPYNGVNGRILSDLRNLWKGQMEGLKNLSNTVESAENEEAIEKNTKIMSPMVTINKNIGEKKFDKNPTSVGATKQKVANQEDEEMKTERSNYRNIQENYSKNLTSQSKNRKQHRRRRKHRRRPGQSQEVSVAIEGSSSLENTRKKLITTQRPMIIRTEFRPDVEIGKIHSHWTPPDDVMLALILEEIHNKALGKSYRRTDRTR